MIKWLTYSFLLFLVLTACEEIYTPEIESREGVLVADARIVVGQPDNFIRLYESRDFNDDDNTYPNVKGAKVSITDNKGFEIKLNESSDGLFPVDFILNPNLEYKIIIVYQGNTYESWYEPVPQIPDLDSVYGEAGTSFIKQSANNNVDEIAEISGVYLYGDILHEKELPYYRFTSRKVLQYTYSVLVGEVEENVFAWSSSYPKEIFNIASPHMFSSSTEIIKHPLSFLIQKPYTGPDTHFDGWILILYQFGLSESAYNYYDDLNKQLDAQGRLFDPLYVQARSNLRCTNNEDQLILGNFEISSVKEFRYFVQYIPYQKDYIIKPIPYFYEIPFSGYQIGFPPDFWESASKYYPDEE